MWCFNKFEKGSKNKLFLNNNHVYLDTRSPFIIWSRPNSMLPISRSGISLIPRNFCILFHIKSLGGLRSTNKPKIRTPWRAFMRSKEDQLKESPLMYQNINSIIQFKPIKKKISIQTNAVLIKSRRVLRSSWSDGSFLLRRLKSSCLWYLVNLMKVKIKRITFPRRSKPIGT